MSDSRVTVRVPILESLAVTGQQTFATAIRSLVPEEKKLALQIFGHSVNLEPVRIASSTLSANAYVTLGNTINVPQGQILDAKYFVHEMTHVWQYQTRGTKYISDSALRQINHSWFQGPDPYKVDIVPGRSFYDYQAEQEAVIIQYYYTNKNGWKTNPDVLRMLGEVRSARPLSAQQIDQERWWGAAGPPKDDFGTPGRGSPTTVPLFRIEF